jgi:PmbA protein
MLNHEIFSLSSNTTSLAFSGGELKTKESDVSGGYGVRVLENNRVGFGYCQNDTDIKKATSEALKAAKFSVKTNFSFPSKATFKKPNLFDKSLDSPDLSELKDFVDFCRLSAEANGGKSRIICSTDSSSIKLENTSGFFGEYRKSNFSIYAECMDKDGFGFAYHSSLKKPKTDVITEVGAKAALMAKEMQGAKKPEAGGYLLVVNVEALSSILLPLLSSFSGDWKRRGTTKITQTKMFSEQLSIYDDGTALATGARPFDDEGVPSGKRALVEDGQVKSFMYDLETSALAGVDKKRSGCCSRTSYSSHPGIGSSNITINPGKCKDLAELGAHIELISAHGSHTANLTSGDIGLEVSNAFLVDKKKRERKPVKGFMISANLFELFANIEAIESRQETRDSIIAPRIAFRDVKVIS